ncbi:MAG TPA: beta-propeller fold lactonase family protein, partial [Gammaproteobacteria bacterium]|nr:beta-propeller fold lactonase family protein [Gammaproteobacteria bacterium]
TGRFLYAVNNGDDTVSAYAIDATSGALTAAAGPVSTGRSPQAVAVEPSGRFVYVATASGVSAYRINGTSGALTPITGAPRGGINPQSIAVGPAGQYLYVANFKATQFGNASASTVSVYAINPVGGSPTFVNNVAAGIQPSSVGIHPNGRWAYVVNKGSAGASSAASNIEAYAIDPATGIPSAFAAGPYPAGFGPEALALDPLGRFAYVSDTVQTISEYTIDAATGALTPLSASPVSVVVQRPHAVQVDPSGRFLYVAGFGNDSVAAYTIDASTGALSPLGSPISSDGVNPDGLAVVGVAQ